MEKALIIEKGQNILNTFNYPNYLGSLASMRNLIASYDGKQNEFYRAIDEVNGKSPLALDNYKSILRGFIDTVKNDLMFEVSFTRKLKIETVNEYLKQAEYILNKKDMHPAVAAFLIGASLEEFLRNWLVDENMPIPAKPSIDIYALALLGKDFLSKQDHKDILSWAGLRNDAAHGYWDKVKDREQIKLMLYGVNSFINRYSKT